METLRQEVHEKVEALGLADAWRFEAHAAAAGEPAESRYLDLARSCDALILIVGEGRSAATEAEYHEAYSDNPDKILPFYLGSTTEAVRDFRRLIDKRHLRVHLREPARLADAAAEAVPGMVTTGRIAVPGLRRQFERRLSDLDRLLDLEPGMSFVPRLQVGADDVDPVEHWRRYTHLAVLQIGGSGKTYGALAALHRIARAPRDSEGGPASQAGQAVVLPLYLPAAPGRVDLLDLVETAFDEVRFRPGRELVESYSAEGRLAIAVDGYDNLGSRDRLDLLASVSAFASRFPRCSVLFLARDLPRNALTMFERAAPSGIAEAALVSLMGLHGQSIRGLIDIPPAVADLVSWPFWASVLARFGLDAESGLTLIQRVISRRLQVVTEGEAMREEKLRDLLATLALAAHPAVRMPAVEAFSEVERWSSSARTTRRFQEEPAEQLLEDIRATGLVGTAEGELALVHPLVAVTLAGEAAAATSPLPEKATTGELAAFTAALLEDDRADDLLGLLEQGDVFRLARVLRLAPPRPADRQPETGVERYEAALRRLAHMAGGSEVDRAHRERVLATHGPGYFAIRHAETGAGRMRASYETLLEGTNGPIETVIWQGDPLRSMLPELLAAAEVIVRFKSRFEAANPRRFRPTSAYEGRVSDLVSDTSRLRTEAMAWVRAVADVERDLRRQLGLSNLSDLPSLDGEPVVRVYLGTASPRMEEMWGAATASVEVLHEDPGYRGYPIGYLFETDYLGIAHERLAKSVERLMGTPIGSHAWNRPSTLSSWVW